MAKKWQVYYNNGHGWREYTTKLDEAEARRRLEAAQGASRRQGDGWDYKLFVIQETPPK